MHSAIEETWAQAEQQIAHARQLHPIDWHTSAYDGIVPPFSLAERDPYEAAHDAVFTIRAILQTFPLRWQIAIVKALGARTAVLEQERRETRHVLSA